MSGSALKLVHVFSAEHHHAHEHPVCELTQQSADTQSHFHTADFLTDDCHLCVYTFSPLETPCVWAWNHFILPVEYASVRFLFVNDWVANVHTTGIFLRGPPTCAA
jgi:hypothetical protein